MTHLAEAILSLYTQDSSTVSRRHLPTASQGLASICPRRAWYEANSPRPSSISALLRRRMLYGTIHEDHILGEVRELSKNGDWELKGAGMRLTLWGVKGRIDGLVREGKVWKLLEIKTMNPEDFKKFQEEGLAAFPRIYEQFMFYLAACAELPFREEDRVRTGILFAENTFPLGEPHAEELGLDEECVGQMEANISYLRELIPLPDPPLRPFPYDSKQCQYCWRKRECWEVRQEERTVSATELPNPQEAVNLVNEYLRHSAAKSDADEKLSEIKGRLRTLMDVNKATRLLIPITQGLSFTVTLQQVSVSEKVTKAYSFPRLDVR